MSAAAQRASVPLDMASSIDALLTKAEAGRPQLVILDLSHAGLDPSQVAKRLGALVPGVAIVAFGPHVHRERLAAATEAGCDLVVSRGQFHAEMDSILARFAG
jgi:DNA-binding NarL/FixJ family response regulator